MSLLKRFSGEDGVGFLLWCPGCKDPHAVRVNGKAPVWGWDGNEEKPTFTPSILVTSGHYSGQDRQTCWCAYNAEHLDDPPGFVCVRCHSFVRAGRIEFFADCSHELAGQTIDLSPWRGWESEEE